MQVPFYTQLDDPGFDAEAVLENAVTDRTVALYINTPNNPSGRVLPDATIDAMMRVAKRHNLWVLCDEAYEEIYFDREPPDAVWKRADTRDRAIAFHTLSKTYGFAGARVGFTHGPECVMTAIRGMQTFHTYCAPPAHAVRRNRGATAGRRLGGREPVALSRRWIRGSRRARPPQARRRNVPFHRCERRARPR